MAGFLASILPKRRPTQPINATEIAHANATDPFSTAPAPLTANSPTPHANRFQATDPAIQQMRKYGAAVQGRPLTAGAPTNEQAAQTYDKTAAIGGPVGLRGMMSKTTVGGEFGRPAADRMPYDAGAALGAKSPIQAALIRSNREGEFLDGKQDTLGRTWQLNQATGKVSPLPEQITSPTPEAFAAAQERVNAIQGGRSENPATGIRGMLPLPGGEAGPVVTPTANGFQNVRGDGYSFTKPAAPSSSLVTPLSERLKAVRANAAEDAQSRQDRVRIARGGATALERAAAADPRGAFDFAGRREDNSVRGLIEKSRLAAEEAKAKEQARQFDAELGVKREEMTRSEKMAADARAHALDLAGKESASRERIAGMQQQLAQGKMFDPESAAAVNQGTKDPLQKQKNENVIRKQLGLEPDTTDVFALTPEGAKAGREAMGLFDSMRNGPQKAMDKFGDLLRQAADGGLSDEEEIELRKAGVTPELLDKMATYQPWANYDAPPSWGSFGKWIVAGDGSGNPLTSGLFGGAEGEKAYELRRQRQEDARGVKKMLEDAKKARVDKPRPNATTFSPLHRMLQRPGVITS